MHSLGSDQRCLFALWFLNFNIFFSKGVYLLFDEVIYINNKQCEKSADAVCYRITWKNNDERHQVLMRHLEMHIKRQPGVFLHSLANWCLSLLPWASLQVWIAVIRLPTGKMIFSSSFWALFDSFPINGRSLRWLQSTNNSSDHTKIYNWTETKLQLIMKHIGNEICSAQIPGDHHWDWLLCSWL